MKKEIDSMNYKQLLTKWRFAKVGDSFFKDDIGKYYSEIMLKKRDELSTGEAVRISKEIGWAV